MKPRTLFLGVMLLCVAKTPAQNQTNTQPLAAPKQSEGGSTLNAPSAIAQSATADQPAFAQGFGGAGLSTNRVLELDGNVSDVELAPIFSGLHLLRRWLAYRYEHC